MPAPTDPAPCPASATSETRSARGLWRNRDFMALWTGETLSTLGSSMSFFLFPIVGYALTGSTTQAALAGAAYSLGSVVTGLPAGVWVDRLNRRGLMVASNLLGVALYAGLGVALLVGHLGLTQLVVTALLTGAAGRFYGPAETAAVKAVVPAEQLPTAFSQNEARQHLGSLVGPPVAGALYAVFAWVPFLVDAASYLASAAGALAVRTPLPAPRRAAERDAGAPGMRREIGEGLRFLWSDGALRAITVFSCIVNFAANALFLVLTLKLLRAGVHPAAIGVILTAAGVAGIVGSLLAPMLIKRVPTGAMSIALAVAIGAVCVPMAFTDNVAVIGGLLALAFLGLPAGNAGTWSYLVSITPDELQGRTQSALMFGAALLMPLGPVLGGLALGLLGGQGGMLLAAGLVCLSGLPLILSRAVRRLGTPDTWPAPPVPIAAAPADAVAPDLQVATAGAGGSAVTTPEPTP